MNSHDYWLWFCSIEELGYRKKEELLARFGSPEALFYAKEDELTRGELTERQRSGILRGRNEEALLQYAERLKEKGVRFIGREEEAYPERLKHIYCPPCGLYVRGALPAP